MKSSIFHPGRILLLLATFATGFAYGQNHQCRNIDRAAMQRSGLRDTDGSVMYVPIVVHLVINTPEMNITHASVFEQIEIINKDFNREHADTLNTLPKFKGVAGKGRIRFFIAEESNASAIIVTQSSHGPFSNADLHDSNKGGQDPWNTSMYLNIWVSDLADGFFGWATSPATVGQVDGIAIDYKYFGKNSNPPYDLGRTLTHEAGHWLGLPHPWGNGGCESDDGFEDTPRQSGPVAACALNFQSCDEQAMVQNFMNTGHDSCLNLFTVQQVQFMRSVLLTLRHDNFSYETPLVTALEPFSGEGEDLQFFPNPFQDWVNFSLKGNNSRTYRLSLFDISGREIFTERLSFYQQSTSVNLSALTPGSYILQITSALFNQTEKIMKIP